MTIYVKYSDFMFKITNDDLVGKTLLFLSVCTMLYNICKGGYRLKFQKLERNYKKQGKIGEKENAMKR